MPTVWVQREVNYMLGSDKDQRQHKQARLMSAHRPHAHCNVHYMHAAVHPPLLLMAGIKFLTQQGGIMAYQAARCIVSSRH